MPPSKLGTSPRVALFDLDGTLTWRDSLVPFLAGYARRHPARWPALWRLLPAVLRYVALGRHRGGHDRGLLKSSIIRTVMGGDRRSGIEAWAELFVERAKRTMFRPAALRVLESHRAAGDHLVLLSASPDLYVPRIGSLLGFERTLCTEIAWHHAPPEDTLDGALRTANRRGEEKCACLERLRAQYAGLPIIAYGNSASDLPLLALADDALLVNAGARARRAAAERGIATALWQ